MGSKFRRFSTINEIFLILLAILGPDFLCEGGHATRKTPVKTIKHENGDATDCVNFYDQPAFDHPMLKDHKIQMDQTRGSRYKTNQQKHDSCPHGTVPIVRPAKQSASLSYYHPMEMARRRNQSKLDSIQTLQQNGLTQKEAKYVGSGKPRESVFAKINIWTPFVENAGEISSAEIGMRSTNNDDFSFLSAGWTVHHGDNSTRIFVSWTTDGFKSTGCRNFDCPGFVQVHKQVAPGSAIRPISTFRSKQYEAIYQIFWENERWWFKYDDERIGYWPGSLFPRMQQTADFVEYIGSVVVSTGLGRHSRTQMGSGHLPSEGHVGVASYFSRVGVLWSGSFQLVDPELSASVSEKDCYGVADLGNLGSIWNRTLLFGGPGLSNKCP